MWLYKLLTALDNFLVALVHGDSIQPMNDPNPNSVPTNPPEIAPQATQAQNTTLPPMAVNPDALIPDWSNAANARHNVRALCDLEGLTEEQKDDLSSTVHCESNYNPNCVHANIVDGKVASTDYGIAQINDFFHIGLGKDFPDVAFVLNNPEACIRWMCRQWKAGNGRLWVCKLRNMNAHYAP